MFFFNAVSGGSDRLLLRAVSGRIAAIRSMRMAIRFTLSLALLLIWA